MKRYAPCLAFVVGIAVVALLMHPFNAAQPRGIRLTRRDAAPIADAAARALRIPVDKAWSALSWEDSSRLRKHLEPNLELRRRAANDPVVGPRLGYYHVMYYRRGLEKYPEYGYVAIDPRTSSPQGFAFETKRSAQNCHGSSFGRERMRLFSRECFAERRRRNSNQRGHLNICRGRTGSFAIA